MDWDFEFISPNDRQTADLPRSEQIILDVDSEIVRSEWRRRFPNCHFRSFRDRLTRMRISDTQYVFLFDWTAIEKDGAIINPSEIEGAFLAAFRRAVVNYKQVTEILVICPTFRGVHKDYGYFSRDIVFRCISNAYWKRRLGECGKRLRVYGWPETWPAGSVPH